MEPNTAEASGSEGQREKKTRRRLRLSCVECTKRRQKCDRKHPCSLCVSRGISHLCRWESVPVVRPTPQRPPAVPSQGQSGPTVQELLARIATLEKALEKQTNQQGLAKTKPIPDTSRLSSPSGSSTFTGSTDVILPSISPSPMSQNLGLPSAPQEDDEKNQKGRALLGSEVFATTTALAQLSFGHHGEYVGRGSFICALHSFSSGQAARYLYATSTNATSTYRDTNLGLSSIAPAERERLIQSLPPRRIAMVYLHSFFARNNWRFGIPEKWFYAACTQMWTTLEYPNHYNTQINANWLSLFFSILAIAGNHSGDDSLQPDDNRGMESTDKYFMCAMAARRIAEDDYLNKPTVSMMASAADGTVLGCLAVMLLCCYLAQRGRASEAWKLVGAGVRNAEAVGMHRDPEWNRWQVMSKDEIDLRRIAWWGLVIWDKMLSYLLGRPPMVRQNMVSVAVPPYIEPDGSKNCYNRGLALFIQLADIAGEALDKCFAIQDPSSRFVLLDLDDRFQQWEDDLPPEYQLDRDEHVTKDIDPAELTVIDQQRYTFTTWYLLCRTKLHLAAITGHGLSTQPWGDAEENPKRCIINALRQMRLQCDTHAATLQHMTLHDRVAFPGNHWFFEGCISLAEATVVLMIIFTRYPRKERQKEAVELVDRAMAVFTHVGSEKTGKLGEVARVSEKIIGALREENWWKSQSQSISASTYHRAVTLPTAPVPNDTKPFDAGYDYSSNLHSSSFQSPLYTLSRIRDLTSGMGFTPDPSSGSSRGVPESRDIHMADLLSDDS